MILIVGDDMGYADIGIHGCKDIPTPHLDTLAKSGVRFTNGYVTGPYCSPTRAALLTGRYQQRFGHEFNPSGPNNGLSLKETTLADRFRTAGYVTGMVGKWHLGGAAPYHPMKRGFDSFFGFLGGAHDYFNPNGILRGTDVVGNREYLTDVFGKEACQFIDKHQSKPFFLYLTFNAVHTPMQADDARLKKFDSISDKKRRTYAAMMLAMDDAVGKVIATLQEKKLIEHTVIAFISDNGGPVMNGTSINGSNNAPLRGSKRTTLEGGIRVPYLLAWPGHIPANTVDSRPVIQIDLYPTLLVTAGVTIPADTRLDGVNLLPYLVGSSRKTEPPHQALYWRFGQQMAVRQGDWKLVKYDLATEGGKGTSAAKLYHLAEDIGETTDVSDKHPDKVKDLQAEWDRWNLGNVKPLWTDARAAGKSN